MTRCGEDDDVIYIGEDLDSDDSSDENVEPSGTLALLRNGPRLSFCRPSLPAQTYVGEQCSAEELPDPSTAPGDEKCSKQQEPILAAMTETSNAMPTLKRLYIPLVRCDQPDDSPADTQLSKFRKLEPGVEKATGLINNRKSSKLRHDKPNSDDNVINNVGDNNDVRGEAETKVTCFMVPPRGRISDESQAFSSPLCYEAPLVHFPQASPIRRRLPASRISFHRQAFSSPLAIDFLGRSETSSSSSMNNFNHSTILDSGREDITVVHIFHRTIKRKIKFDLYPEEVSDLECFNQMMNLERNTIFGNYWHVYVPNCRLNNSKTFFTEYHEAFVEAALELGEDPVGEALSFMKDFQSKRCPTLQSISNIIAAWQRNKTHCKDQNTNLVCVIMQIFASYPEMAKAYVDSGLLSAILDNRTEQSEYSMFMAALELDFFTRTLCDPFSFRRSLVFSFLSLSKNRKNIECIVNLIKDNIRKLDMAPSSIGEDLHDNASEPCKNVGEAKGKVLFELHRCNQASLRDSELDRVAQDFSHTSAVFPRRCSEGAKVGEIHRESTNTFSAVSKLKAIVSSVNKETHAVASHTAQPTQPHPGASTSTKCLLSSTSEQVKGDGAITTEGAPLPIDSFCVSSSAARVGPDAHKIGRYATLDLGDQPNPMPSTSVTGIFFQQRLLALALECSTTDKDVSIAQLTELLKQAYDGANGSMERQLLLGSIFSPLLTSALAQRVLTDRGYVEVPVPDESAPGNQTRHAGPGGATQDQSWRLSFQSKYEFLQMYTAAQQEEFTMLFYNLTWGTLEASKNNMHESRRHRLLNFGLSAPSMPWYLHQCVTQVRSMVNALPEDTREITRYFLSLTNCLLESVPN